MRGQVSRALYKSKVHNLDYIRYVSLISALVADAVRSFLIFVGSDCSALWKWPIYINDFLS